MSKITRCKFTCQSMTKRKGWNGHPFVYEFEFSVVTRQEGEDAKFFAATPGGSIKLVAVDSEAFVVGADYYFDAIPCEGPA